MTSTPDESWSEMERRLHNRLMGARLQLEYRISDNQELRAQIARLQEEKERLELEAQAAREQLRLLMTTKTLRAMRLPRAVYARLRHWNVLHGARSKAGEA